ncbi:MAG: InlB B-repeat-containing protein [Candidatus Electronema sp. V4]|uniref:InlB B-repeat-containing protein n=1 Tax=Candidatus Electronema sp. V4 TaxID=3454756 RepID=UPI0040559B68
MKRRTNRRPSRPHLLAIAAILLLLTAPRLGFSLGPWTNGQDANLVLGQPDLTTARNCDIEECNGADRMDRPEAVAVDPTTGKVFVADSSNSRVLRFASGAALTSGAAAEAVLGQPDFVTTTWGAAPTAANMFNPQALVVDAGGRLWVADSGHDRVLRFDSAAAKANGANADGVLGRPDFTTSADSLARQNTMIDPEGLAVDADGRLWVADTWNNRVLRFDNATAKGNGADADAVLGQTNFTDRDYATAQNRMYLPRGLVVTSTGVLFVADQRNNRVLRFDNAVDKGNGADADGVLGQADFISSGIGYRTRNGMYYPIGVSHDSEGRLYVAEEGNSRVFICNNAVNKPNGADADNVLGQPDFTTATPLLSASGLSTPLSVFADNARGALWVADRDHNRVLRYVGQAISAYVLTVSKNGTGSGAVTSNPPGISCGSTCGASFTAGQSVTLTAAAASGSTFAGWSGACSGTGSCTVTMDADKSATASFTAKTPGSSSRLIPAVQQLLLKK